MYCTKQQAKQKKNATKTAVRKSTQDDWLFSLAAFPPSIRQCCTRFSWRISHLLANSEANLDGTRTSGNLKQFTWHSIAKRTSCQCLIEHSLYGWKEGMLATTATLVWCLSTISRVCCGPCGCCDSFLTVIHFCLSLSLHYGGSVAHGILVGYVKFPGEADPSVFSSSSSRSGSNSISIHYFIFEFFSFFWFLIFHFDAFFIIPPLAPLPPPFIYSFLPFFFIFWHLSNVFLTTFLFHLPPAFFTFSLSFYSSW